MANVTKLMDTQVDEITLLSSNLPYKTGKRAENKETYSRFRYNGVVFNVPDNSPFIKDFQNGTVSSVKLIENERPGTDEDGNEITIKGFEFDSHTTFAQELNRATHKAKMNLLTATASSKDLTPEAINALMAM
jgi:hypothetical protein